MNGAPITKDLVLVGGGHSHVFVLKAFGMRPMPGVRLTLVTRESRTPYSGMLPGFIAGHYSFDECHIDLRPLAAFAGARLYRAEAMGLDLANRRLLLRDRPPIPYDILSLDIGSRPRQDDVPGSVDHAVPVKPIDGFATRFERILRRAKEITGPLCIAIVGGGAAGVELTLAIQYRLRRELTALGRNPGWIRMRLLTETGILPTHNARARRIFSDVLAERAVEVFPEHRVARVEAGRLHCVNGETVESDETLWVTDAGAASWLRESGLSVDARGFVHVHDTLRTVTDPNVFAAGDVAAVQGHPRPKAGVFAVRQGPPLAENLRRALVGQPLEPFVPQKLFLSLITTGDRVAVASKGPLALRGAWLWKYKDSLDREWMRKYTDLPAMTPHYVPSLDSLDLDDGMRCGGCGAKVGSTVLSRVLERLKPASSDGVVVGIGDDAAIVRAPAGKALVQTIDFFRAFVDDPYIFGRIAAVHALGDVFAMGAEPHTALALATVPLAGEAQTEDALFQMMSGALSIFDTEKTALVGGHTSESAELGLGFTINGFVDEKAVLRKSGLVAGQALVLTKPLGTGALFAADMRRKADGRWIAAALASMQQSSREAAAILRAHGATACTDVTGFGLLGHLAEMLRASKAGATLDLQKVPFLAGAEEVVQRGFTSSLQAENARATNLVRDSFQWNGDTRFALLFDPQTAGGLLAGIPAERSDACVTALRAAGYAAASVIGHVAETAREPIVVR